jgi:hypothetical protein
MNDSRRDDDQVLGPASVGQSLSTREDDIRLLEAAHASIARKVSVISPPPNVEAELQAIHNVAARLRDPNVEVPPHGEFAPSTGGVNSTAQSMAMHANAGMRPGGQAAPDLGTPHEYAPGEGAARVNDIDQRVSESVDRGSDSGDSVRPGAEAGRGFSGQTGAEAGIDAT